ncbi:MerR family transcriptional regulator [Kribbella italica]|uniref:DNA-binding transcriptional MerR regulator n=1 Tax=Kribbella italica TaxID=1540520 RepID=A0A7W9JB72_9ACTN|nr:DNA-binding transcriptional MerR regulator [Kribbella italica]
MVDDLVSISAFARRVGLTPSALRFYDDCGALRPAVVDEGNGYRYYAPDQEQRARLLRDLREIDLPLPEVRRVLDGAPGAAAAVAVVEAHLRTVEQKAASTRQAAQRILAGLSSTSSKSPQVTLGGPELASAIRQVAPAAAEPEPIPALGCVRIELSETEVTLVATDRYRLAVRKLHPQSFDGTPGAILIPAPALTELTRWLAAADTVHLRAGSDLTLSTSAETRTLASMDAEYPDYQLILDGLEPPVCRVMADRAALAELLGTDEVVALGIESETIGIGNQKLEAIITGAPLRIGFTTRLLAEALATGVGPDVLLEIHAPDRPVVIRSADQGTFTTLVMPNRL